MATHPPPVTEQPSTPPRPLGLRRSAAALATADHRLGWAPIVAALAIDLADIATAGPIGLVAGLFVGGILTTTVSMLSGARLRRALALGFLGAIYCALPLTETIPMATMLTALYGYLHRSNAAAPAAESTPEPEPFAAGRVVQAGPGQRHATT